MTATFGLFIVVLAIAVVVWLARTMGDEGVATSLDAPWARFCDDHGFELLPARPLVGEKWPMISGVAGDVALSIDVLEEQLGTRTLVHTRLRATSTHPRPGVLRCAPRSVFVRGTAITTGDVPFDEELTTVADNDEVARVLSDDTRSALLALAQQKKLTLEVDNGGVTLLVRDVLGRREELSSAMDVLIGYAEGDAGLAGNLELITYDTSTPSALKKIDHQPVVSSLSALPSAPLALTGTPATNGAGGRLSLYSKSHCAPPTCTLQVQNYLVPNSSNPPSIADQQDLEDLSAFGRPAWGTIQCANRSDLIMYPKTKDAGASTAFNEVVRYDPFTLPAGTTVGSRVSVPAFKGGFLRRAAVDSADQIMFAVETNSDLQLHAVSLVTGQSMAIDTNHSGQSVYYDPASKTVFAPFNQGDGKDFGAFRVTNDPDAGVGLKRRTTADWNPPTDLRPNLLGIHEPLPVKCN